MLSINTKSLHNAAWSAVTVVNIIFSVLITETYGSNKVAHAATTEVRVTTARVEDFEFNATNAQFTFIDSNNRLWIGKVNTTPGHLSHQTAEVF